MAKSGDERILILDFGSQYTQLIARRIRELGVFSEVRPFSVRPAEFDLNGVRAVVLSGGPASTTDQKAPTLDPGWLELGRPVLGICYGMQLLAKMLGGAVGRGECREYGQAKLRIDDRSSLFAGLPDA